MPYPIPLQVNGGSSPLCKIEVNETHSKHLLINCTDNSIDNQTYFIVHFFLLALYSLMFEDFCLAREDTLLCLVR